ncbi:GNAT family N-acetyltransferase, partial [bacterium]|nr:GNAT family N-acetyltransferase [bacterium]
MNDYQIKTLSNEEFMPLYNQYRPIVFEQNHSYNPWSILSEEELQKAKELNSLCTNRAYMLYLAVFDQNDQFVAWSYGRQESGTEFHMLDSGVLKDHRRKGIYSLLLNRSIEILSEKGFQVIFSRHCATNNAVIIPKLKAGFLISKMEINDKFGFLI